MNISRRGFIKRLFIGNANHTSWLGPVFSADQANKLGTRIQASIGFTADEVRSLSADDIGFLQTINVIGEDGGSFYWDANSSDEEWGQGSAPGVLIKPYSIGELGAYRRDYQQDAVRLNWFIDPDIENHTAAFLASARAGSKVFCSGTYNINDLQIVSNTLFVANDETVFNVSSTGVGIGWLFGVINPADTRSDNLPVYNGLLTYWDEDNFSPATVDYPRISNCGVVGGTIIINSSMSIGVAFYRTNDAQLDCHVKFSGVHNCGNSVRGFMNKGMNWGNTEVDGNAGSTYSFFSYWSYGDRGNTLKTGPSLANSFEFKHAVNAKVDTLECSQDSASKLALSIGYGSRGVVIDRLESKGGVVQIKSSSEFDYSRDIRINTYDIENTGGDGFRFQGVRGLVFVSGDVKADTPVVINANKTHVFTSESSIVPVQNSSPFVFDGNYDTVEVVNGVSRYHEYRPNPALLDFDFGLMRIIQTDASAGAAIKGTVYQGLADTFDANGKYKRGVLVPSGRAEDEELRFDYQYSNDFCASIKRGKGVINYFNEGTLPSEVVTIVNTLLDVDLVINIETNSGVNIGSLYGVFHSNLKATMPYAPATSTPILKLYTFVDSKLSGVLKPNIRGISFESTGALYKDGFEGAKISVDYVYAAAPASNRINITNFTSPDLMPAMMIDFSGSTVRRVDGGSLAVLNSMIYSEGTMPTGIDDNGGWIGDVLAQGKFIVRQFTAGNAATKPPYIPRFIGEQVENLTGRIWWEAKSLTDWSVK